MASGIAYQPNARKSSAAPVRRTAGHGAGVVLVTAGAMIAAFVVVILVGGLYDPEKLPLLNFVQERLGGGGVLLEVMAAGKQIQIRGSQNSGLISGLVVSVMILGTLGKIARTLLSVGMRLMDRPARAS